MSLTKIIVLDDDPTGSQTVHGCMLLTRWDVASLIMALRDPSPLFFVLTNSRAMDGDGATRVTREVCRAIRNALEQLADTGVSIQSVIVSRSDSTLRGHYPLETDIIASELGPFDALFMVPAFFEGGRVTRDSTHYLRVGPQWVPVHETEFACDAVFGYHASYLPEYIAEKTNGRISADTVERILLTDLTDDLVTRMARFQHGVCCVVDAVKPDDLAIFATAALQAINQGKRFLFRSAASLLNALVPLPPQPVAAEHMGQFVRADQPGAVIVGSHVGKSTRQLDCLLTQAGVVGVEVDVLRMDTQRESLLDGVVSAVSRVHAAGKTPVVFTSRNEVHFPSQGLRLEFGKRVSAFLMDIVRRLPETLGYLVSKGGITSNDVLSSGLELRAARVLGQVLPGCSVICCPDDHPRFSKMPVVIFPGNVGDDDGLVTVYNRLAVKSEPVVRTAKA